MKSLIIKLICLIIIFNFLFPYANVYAASQSNLTDKQKAIINIANAYYSQGKGIQYDQQRRFLNAKPEEAKNKWPIYLDCSSFVYNVYLQAFDIKLHSLDSLDTYLNKTKKQIEEAKNECNSSYKNVIKTSENEDAYIPCYVSNTQKISHSSLKNLKKLLQPGDLIVYRRTSGTGHVILYLGNNELIHCTGKKYNYDDCKDYSEKAGIEKMSLSDSLLNSNSSRYLLKSNIERFAVIRPLKAPYLKDAKLTEYAKIKNNVPKLDIVTTSYPWHLKTVNPGSKIKYVLHLKNNGTTTINNLIVKDKVSQYLTVDKNSIITTLITKVDGVETEREVTNTVTIDDNNILSCKINSLSPNTKIKIKYKAIITDNPEHLGKTIKSQIQVGKVVNNETLFESTNTIKNIIGRTLTKEEQNSIVEVALKYKNKKYDGKTRNLIDKIYKKSLNIDVNFGDTTIKEMFSNIMYKEDGDIKLKSNNTKTRKMVVENMYGYKYGVNTGTRYLDSDNLIPGDVIIYTYKKDNTNKYVIYLYLSPDELMTINSGKVVIHSNVQSILNRIIGSQKFAVLRPSLDM